MNDIGRTELMQLTNRAFHALSLAEEKVKEVVASDDACTRLCDRLYAIRQSIVEFEREITEMGDGA